jgi:hypothetical protein
MPLKSLLRRALAELLATRGLVVVERDLLLDWQRDAISPARRDAGTPPPAHDWLRGDNPELLALRQRYARFDPAVTTPLVWTAGVVNEAQLREFRGHNAYVWQQVETKALHNLNPAAYALAFYYLRSNDDFGLFSRCTEDGAFGVHTLELGGRLVSRDLLDSVGEMTFLERHLKLSARKDFRVQAFPSVTEYLCTDGFATSTFLCDYYLRFRGVQGRARAVPLDEIEAVVLQRPVDLAVNVHSFSECRQEAIEWWVALLGRARVRYLMIIPNEVDSARYRPLTNDGRDIQSVVEAQGYRLLVAEPKYADPMVQRYALNPAWHFLYELT